MKIFNYDVKDDPTNFKQRQGCEFMPSQSFRLLICGNSGSGKTNLLLNMILRLLYFDSIHLYAKNLDQSKYKKLMDIFQPISKKVGYDVIKKSNDEITPVDEIDVNSQKLVIFDDFVCDKNQDRIIDYFLQTRHKNASVIYLSQSFFMCPKNIRLNCSHFCIYNFPSTNEVNMISRETGISKEQYKKCTNGQYDFAYIDKVKKKHAKKTLMRLSNVCI